MFVGSAPIGGPTLGYIADHVRPRAAVAAASLSAVAGASLVWIALRRGTFNQSAAGVDGPEQPWQLRSRTMPSMRTHRRKDGS